MADRPVDITPRILRFFDHPRFRGLWFIKYEDPDAQRRWTVTYQALNGEFVETRDHDEWRDAMLDAMEAVKNASPPRTTPTGSCCCGNCLPRSGCCCGGCVL